MKNFDKKNMNFGAKSLMVPFSLILFICITVCLMGTAVAFLFTYDWSSNKITMSGKVDIEAVGNGTEYGSIEDTVSSSNLIIDIQNGSKYLMPGVNLLIPANVKVYKSTSKPLLRAKFKIEMTRHNGDGLDEVFDEEKDIYDIMPQMTASLHNIITGNGWLLDESDMYYYFVGENARAATLGDTLMSEVSVKSGDVVVHFINDYIKFPVNVGSEMSGVGVKFIITFEAIQNFIPDRSGNKLANTITNSKIIFEDQYSEEK